MNITNDKVTEYIQGFYKPLTSDLEKLRLDSEEKKIPIIVKETEMFLKTFLEVLEPKRILEIGCAVGYSSMFMAEVTHAKVDTIEVDLETYNIAKDNINRMGYSSYVFPHLGDGEEVLKDFLTEDSPKFDIVFIDAAKSHYKRFLEASIPYTTKDTVFISDNVLFRARVASDEYDPTGKYKTNIKKLRDFNYFIMNDDRFSSTIISVGDGLAITRFKDEVKLK